MEDNMTFETGMAELESLVKGLESGQMTLEDSFKAFECAMKIRDALNKMLDDSDRRIRVLTDAGERDLAGEEAQ